MINKILFIFSFNKNQNKKKTNHTDYYYIRRDFTYYTKDDIAFERTNLLEMIPDAKNHVL